MSITIIWEFTNSHKIQCILYWCSVIPTQKALSINNKCIGQGLELPALDSEDKFATNPSSRKANAMFQPTSQQNTGSLQKLATQAPTCRWPAAFDTGQADMDLVVIYSAWQVTVLNLCYKAWPMLHGPLRVTMMGNMEVLTPWIHDASKMLMHVNPRGYEYTVVAASPSHHHALNKVTSTTNEYCPMFFVVEGT